MCDSTCCFEPTFTFMGFVDCLLDVRPPFAVEGRSCGCGNPPSGLLGVKIQEPAFWG